MTKARRAPRAAGKSTTTTTTIELPAPAEGAQAKPRAALDPSLDRVLEKVASPDASAHTTPITAASVQNAPARAVDAPSLRVARLAGMEGSEIKIVLDGSTQLAKVTGVDRELLRQAVRANEAVLVEHRPGEPASIVAVLQTRVPAEIVLKAATVTIEAEREILLRAGRSGLRLREDGDIELVGSRVVAMSRGLFRLVGRMLRLN
jgi:hypothetical protein